MLFRSVDIEPLLGAALRPYSDIVVQFNLHRVLRAGFRTLQPALVIITTRLLASSFIS